MDGIIEIGGSVAGTVVFMAAILKYWMIPKIQELSVQMECMEDKNLAMIKLLRDVVITSNLHRDPVIKADLRDVEKILNHSREVEMSKRPPLT